MDQSVIETLKRRYRKTFIQELVRDDNETSLKEYWKGYHLKMVIDNVSDAWAQLSAVTLRKSWNKLWPPEQEQSSGTDENADVLNEILATISAALELENNEIKEWLQCDAADIGHHVLTDDEIIDHVNEGNVDSEMEDAEYDGSELEVAPKPVDLRKAARNAASGMQTFIDWYEQQSEATHVQTMLYRKARIFAMNKSMAQQKQTKLTDHFAPKEN